MPWFSPCKFWAVLCLAFAYETNLDLLEETTNIGRQSNYFSIVSLDLLEETTSSRKEKTEAEERVAGKKTPTVVFANR